VSEESDPSVTASEFVFLALGLVLGLASGAALVEIVRARPSPPRQVRVTVAQDAVPRRRAATLADDAFLSDTPPAPGGPADRLEAVEVPPTGADPRTSVRSTTADAGNGTGPLEEDEHAEPKPGRVLQPAFPLTGPAGSTTGAELTPVPVDSGVDPMLAALRASAAATAVSAMRAGAAASATAEGPRPVAMAATDPPGGAGEASGSGAGGTPTGEGGESKAGGSMAGGGEAGGSGSQGGTGTPPPPTDPTGPCADERRLADERCELATRARTQAMAAEDAVRAAQRAYDEHEARANAASATADPRAVRRAKDEAQANFRAQRGGATTNDEVEAAARDWLLEVNRINGEARDAAVTMQREREAARGVGASLERVALEAEAARIAAETAEAACLAARQAVADCEERAVGGVPEVAPAEAATIGPAPAAEATIPHEEEPLALALGTGRTPRIFRLLRGDRSAMTEILAVLAGEDPAERRRWQLGLSDLVDAILADSIEHASLEFPSEHTFWGPFTLEQNRDISSALSSLGYRFDGLGGWVDGRVPSQRDLSLALGYAGLDPMRIRHWPTERDMTQLYSEVAVAADEHLAARAGDLTLGELVTMLGRRADGLAEIWNSWGRLRPLLLEET
jgi:hypothetical protein